MNIGGPALHVALLSRGLSPKMTENAFETTLVHGEVAPGEEEMAAAFSKLDGIEVIRLPHFSRAISPIKDLLTFIALFRIIRRVRPQIVHTHKSKAGVLGRIAAFLLRVPVRVHTFHGQVFEGYFPGSASRLIVRIERFLSRLTHAVLAISPALKEELQKHYEIADAARIHCLPLGLELAPLASPAEKRRLQKDFHLPPETPAVGIVGRLVPIKNHELFLKAMRRLAEERHDLHFFVVGGGELAQALAATAVRLGLGERCYFTGFRDDLPEVYASLDALALTSDNEGTPVVLIEALAAGVPVVASKVGGVGDVLDGGRLGRLFPRGDEAALAAALRETLAKPPAPAAREGARQRMLERYSSERLCRDMAALYRDLLDRAGYVTP